MKVIVGAILLCWAAGAQPNWVQLSPSTVPPGREAGVMAYDGARHQIVMFGGAVISGNIVVDGNDTWLWDGQNWNATSPSTKPPARDRPCMIYDPRIQKVVMFGGGGTRLFGDTWVWDGTNWTQIDTSSGTPAPAACYSSFGFDEAHQQAILFIAADFTTLNSQTWSWDGSAWTQLHPVTNPPYLSTAEMAYDRARGELVLTTYTDNPTNNNFASTWAWSGTNWVRKPPSGDHLPFDQNPGQAVYDAVHQQILIFLQSQQTWAWNGTAWSLLHPTVSPSDRILMAEAFDEVNQRVVGFGGGINVAPFLGNDTWAYTEPTPTVHITVPLGAGFTFNGLNYTGSHTIQVAAGTYTLSTTSPQATDSATQLVFRNWSDGGAISHSVTVPVGGLNLTATFGTQYNLSTVANPSSGGTVSSGGFYDAGATASPTETPNAGFSFANWSGACSGSGACTVVMNAPAAVTANFNAALVQFTVNVPAAAKFTFNGTTYTGTQTIAAPPGSYTLSTTTPQATVAGTQLAFAAWSDGGGISHTVTLSGAAQSITGTFHTQYLLTTAALPVNDGTVAPLSGGPYFDSGSLVNVGSVANPGFQFQYWSGACVGSAPVCQVLMSAPLTVVGNFTATPKWIQLGPANSPPARYSSAMAFDAGRNEMVLFGGIAGPSYVGDTWTWNGTNWNLRSSAGPSPRAGVAMAYDPAHGQMVMFGGTTPASLLNETWIWDGNAGVWTPMHPAVSPSPRYFASLAWDGTRLILFGGLANPNNTGAVNDTWAWTGSNWVQLAPATSPPARGFASMTYDAARNQVVLFGGQNTALLGDTWIWNGSNWVAMAPVTSPIARSAAALAYDPVIQQSVLFAGFGPAFPDEVWLWDGANWKSAPESPSPSDRYVAAMAYDPARQQVLLFGGFDSASEGDTWIFANNATQQFYTLTTAANPVGAGTVAAVSPGQAGPSYRAGSTITLTASTTPAAPFEYWSGACAGQGSGSCNLTMLSNLTAIANYPPPPKWIQLGPANSPTARYSSAMAFDAGRNEMVLFGGIAGPSYVGDTWSWNGTNWSLRSSAGPSPRAGGALAYDPANGQMVMFGGTTPASSLNETWIWDGNAGVWTQQHPAVSPSPRYRATLVWDGTRLILFGGYTGAVYLNDTWAWTGSNWVQLSPATSPAARGAAAATYDAAHNQVVLFGGQNAAAYFSDTWVWTGSNWVAKAPASSPIGRSFSAFAYDPVIQQSVLFAGADVAFPDEVWLWDGANWKSAPESPSPSDRFAGAMAYDPARQQVLLFGGFDSASAGDTWIFANNAVQQFYTVTTAANPVGAGTVAAVSPGQAGPSYRAGSTVTLTASSTPAAPFEYWTGACAGAGSGSCALTMLSSLTAIANYPAPPKWISLGPAKMPQSRYGTGIAFDSSRGETVLFTGGYQDHAEVYANETWIWDGSNWSQRFPAAKPASRDVPAMAYDVTHHQVVLFGGANLLNVYGDTWIWDGASATWTQANPLHSPAGRAGANLAWDGTRLILFGGRLMDGTLSSETWAWSGTDWSLLSAPGGPGARQDGMMTFDPVRRQVVLFGGRATDFVTLYNDTWTWDGAVWTKRSSAATPSPRSGGAIAWHGAIQQVVLFSGVSAAGFIPDTWLWDGTNWTLHAEPASPSGQSGSAAAWDSTAQQMILLSHYAGDYGEMWIYANNAVQQFHTLTTSASPAAGGTVSPAGAQTLRAGALIFLSATAAAGLEFQGWTGACAGSFGGCVLFLNGDFTVTANFGYPLSWLQLNPATSAAPKGNLIFQNPVSMAFDVARQQVVYFGGPAGDQTWTWNGTTWTKRSPLHSPPARSGQAMAYDAARQRVILFGGGTNSLALRDTWSWDGTDWTLVDAGTGPARRFNHAMAYDRVRQEILMFGGVDENLNFYPDTWVWNGGQWILRQASGGPPVRSDFGMAFDPVNAEVVISSGFEGQNDTWGWNGSTWTKKLPLHLPPSTSNHFCQMAYDERLQRAVLLIDNYPAGPQTWVWNGFDWTQLSPTQSPTPRAASGVVYDGVRGQVLLFGGDGVAAPLNDTWVLTPPTAILSIQSVSATKNAAGNYLVTFALKNTGNTAANAVFGFSATAVTLAGGATTTTNTFPLGQFSIIQPGASGTFQAQFPASAGSGAHNFSAQGSYAMLGGTGSWSIAVRSVVFP